MGFRLYATSQEGKGSTFVIGLDPGRTRPSAELPPVLNAGSTAQGKPAGRAGSAAEGLA